MSSHECETYQCILRSTSWRNNRVDEHTCIVSHLGNNECLGVAGDCTALQEDVVATFLEKVDYKGQIIIQELDIDTPSGWPPFRF